MAPTEVAKNSKYINNRIAPSLQPSLPRDKKYHKRRLAIKEKTTRSRKTSIFIVKGKPTSAGTNNVIPRIKVMFMKQLPTMFPKAKAECPFKKAFTLVENSGKLVPNAIIVAPMRVLGTPANSAIVTADSTIK